MTIENYILGRANKAMQSILDAWIKLDLEPCEDIHELVFHPQGVYDRAINKLITIPETAGKFKINRSKFREQLDLPDPKELISLCSQALKIPFTSDPEMWIVKGEKVEISGEAYLRISDEKKDFIEDLHEMLRLHNKCNASLGGKLLTKNPWSYNHFAGKFDIVENNGFYDLVIIPDKLKEWLE